jgi:lipooligosaccharide transport system permease protein
MPVQTLITSPARRGLPVWRRNLKVWGRLAGPALLASFGEPLLVLLALGYGLGAFVGELGGLPYLHFLATGILCASAMNTASFEGMYSAYTRMTIQRTWEGMLAAPLEVDDIVLGEAIWAGSKGLISGTAILVVIALFGVVDGPMAVLALGVILLTGVCFGALALVVTAFATSYDFFLYYFTLVVTPMYLLSGVFFPLEQMPPAVQAGAQCLPLAHAVALVRPLVIGQPLANVALHLGVIAAYAGVGLYLATRLMRRRLTS